MGKIIKINEKQYQTILESVNKGLINEDDRDHVFKVNVPIIIEGPSKLHDRYISIENPKYIPISFQIEIYYKSWGIDDIQIHNIKGPRQLAFDFTIEPEQEYDERGHLNSDEMHEHTIILDWDSEKINTHNPEERPTLHTSIEHIEIVLNDALFVEELNVYLR